MDFDHPIVQLQNDRVSLAPFKPELHNYAVFAAFTPHPNLFTYLSINPFTAPVHVSEWYEHRFRINPSATLFVVFDKTRRGPDDLVLAGLIALIETNPHNLVTEIGWVMILPDFQRTHVTTNAVGLLLHYCLDASTTTAVSVLDPISGSMSGLGLRRVQWQANEDNKPSVRAATRLGFRYEGIMRWHRTLLPGKAGPASRACDPKLAYPGRHTVVLSICWDDWEGGVRDKVRALMAK